MNSNEKAQAQNVVTIQGGSLSNPRNDNIAIHKKRNLLWDKTIYYIRVISLLKRQHWAGNKVTLYYSNPVCLFVCFSHVSVCVFLPISGFTVIILESDKTNEFQNGAFSNSLQPSCKF